METKNKIILKILPLAALTPITGAQANSPQGYKSGVNIKDASYYIQANDLPQHSIFQRVYTSTNSYRGYYGRGWCSEIDKKIEIKKDLILFIDCRYSDPIQFTRIGSEYFSSNNQKARRVADDHIQIDNLEFNPTGQLVKIRDKKQRIYKISYTNDKPSSVSLNDKLIANIVHSNATKTIQSVHEQNQHKIIHHYENGNLVWTKSNRLGTQRYIYNQFHNLTQWSNSTGKKEDVEYDDLTDRVLVKKSGKCQENYSYSDSSDGMTLAAEVNRSCGQLEISKTNYDFKYVRNLAGERSLHEMKIKTSRGQLEVQYDLASGQTLKVKESK
jgi:hypothetical protein